MRKSETRHERLQGIHRTLEPLRVAKKTTIKTLGAIGRKHKYLRYPIFIGLVAFIFVYNVFFHAFIQFKMREKMARAMAVSMTLILVLTSVDLSVLALSAGQSGYYNLTSYETESGSVMVPLGTVAEEIELPESLISTMDFYAVEETETPSDAEVPSDAEIPSDAEVPVSTETPSNAEVPASTETPSDAEVPASTVTPSDAEAPENTEISSDATVPESTEMPSDAVMPEGTDSTTTSLDTDNTVDVTVETVTVVPEQMNAAPEDSSELQVLSADENVETEETATSETEVNDEIVTSEASEAEEIISSETVEEGEQDITTEISDGVYEETITTEVPVTWYCENYDANTLGEYVFVAQFPTEYKGNVLNVAVETMPAIVVKVVEPQIVIGTQIVDGIEIEMKAAPGVFPEDAVMSVTKVTDEEIVALIEETIQKEIDDNKEDEEDQTTLQSTITFDIVVLDGAGNEIQPEIPKGMTEQEAVCVTFKQVVPVLEVECEEDEVTNMQVYYVEDTFDEVEAVETGTSGEDVLFNPEHFSYYSCACTHSSYKSVSSWKSLYQAIYNKTGTVNVKLTSDITISKLIFYSNSNRIYIHKGQTVNLNLNGYDIRSYTGEEAVELEKGKFNLHDTNGNGTISAAEASRVIYVTGDQTTLNIYGGTIRKAGDESWGVDVVANSYINMNGGRIYGSFSSGIWASAENYTYIKMEGGEIDGSAQGIYYGGSNASRGSVSMVGGTIKNYKSYGIYNGGTVLHLNRGTIAGNSSYKAYGVYVNGANATVRLNDSILFSNNRAADIYVGSYVNNRIEVAANLGGTDIGIATAATPTDNAPVQFTVANEYAVNNMDKFYSKASSSYGVWNPNDTNYLVTGPMGNRTITAEMVFVETNPATNANGEVAKLALGTATPVASNASAKDISTVVKFNTPMTFNATLVDSTNYEFKGWKKQGTTTILSTSPTYTFDAKDNVNLEAVFVRKTCTVTIKTSAVSMGTVAYVSSSPSGKGITTNAETGVVTGTFEMGSVITVTATAKEVTSSNPKAYYKLAQWSDGVEGTTEGQVTTRQITVSEDNAAYIAQFRYPDPDPNATGTLFIGVEQLHPSAYCYTSQNPAQSAPSKVILIGAEYGEMANTAGGTLAIAGLPGNSARLSVLTSTKDVNRGSSTDTLGKAETYYDAVTTGSKCADSATHHGSTTATSSASMGIYAHGNTSNGRYSVNTSSIPANGYGYYVCIDLKQNNNIWSSDNLYKGDAFDTCPGGWIAYSSTCGKWHYWCNNGGVQGAGPYYAYAYDKAVSFTAWEKDSNNNPISSNISVKVNELKLGNGTNQDYIESADVTVTIKATDGNYYTLANAVFTGETGNGIPAGAVIDFANGDRVIEFNLNGVAFNHTLPEAIISRGTGEDKTQTEYTYIRDALQNAVAGDIVYVYGPAISEISGEGIEVAEGVKIISYDGTEITLDANSTLNAEKDGTIELLEGTMTATPAGDGSNVEVSVTGATVTAKEEITVSTDSKGKGQVSTSEAGADISISPDGDANHKVVFEGCIAGKTYGVNAGEMTTEDKVTISGGTEYDLTVPSTGGSEKVVSTDSTNTGTITITQGQDADKNDTVVVESTNANDSITVTTTSKDTNGQDVTVEQNYTTSEANTKLVISDKTDEVILEQGGVNVPSNGSVILPNGEVIENTSGVGGNNITVSVDDNGSKSVAIPGGGSANVGGTEISVPNAEPANLPVDVELNNDGTLDVTAQSGNSVMIGGETYEIGDYNATFEVDPNAGEDAIPVVKEGTVVLQPGQSITDSNGVTYTNPPVAAGEESKPIEITMTEGQSSEVNVAPGQSFEYTPAGENKAIEYVNPSASDTTFMVDEKGEVSLGSDISLGEGNNVNTNFGEVNANVEIPTGNTGTVDIDPIEGNITIQNAGDRVIIGTVEYEASEPGTVFKPGKDGVELSNGGVTLDSNEDIIINGTKIENSGSGECTVSQKKDEDGNPTGEMNVEVPNKGSFTMTDPVSGQGATFTNPGSEADYTIDDRGNLVVPADKEVAFKQNGVTTTVKAPEDGDVTIVPSEDGVEITAPAGKDVTINDTVYENVGSEELGIVVDEKGNPVLIEGTTQVPDGGKITLPGGDVIGAENGNVTVDASGILSVPDGVTTTITKDGITSSYTADGNVNLEYDPETGVPTLGAGSIGSVELGSNSKIDVIYNTIEETDETFEEYEKATITNTGKVPASVDGSGNIEVPKGGSVIIDSEVKAEDGTAVPVQNKVSVPSNAQNNSVSMVPQSDGTVDVTLDSAGDSVNVNGMEYTAGSENTKISVAENGSTLESGSVSLDGGKMPKESINVNGTCVTSSGKAGTTVTAGKNADGTVELGVSAGGTFDLSVPGLDETKVTFTNPSKDNNASYTVENDGSILVEDGDPISFITSNGKAMEVFATGAENAVDNDLLLKVTENGVELSADSGTDINVGGETFENIGALGEDLTITVDSNGNPVLNSGDVAIPDGADIRLPDGNIVQGDANEDGDKVTVTTEKDSEGNINSDINVPNGATVTITTPSGSVNNYTATTDNVKITTDESENPTLKSGSVAVGDGSKIKVNDTVIQGMTAEDSNGQKTEAPVVDANGKMEIPAGSGVIFEKEIINGEGKTEVVKTTINTPSDNSGSVDVTMNADSYDVKADTLGDEIGIDGSLYETTAAPTTIKVSDNGKELTEGGVVLDGNQTPKESIIVNGTEVKNVGEGTVSVEKLDSNNSKFTVESGGEFELSVPGVPGSGVVFTNPDATNSAEYTVDGDGNIALGENSEISFKVGNKDCVVGGGEGVSMKVTEDGVQLTVEPGKAVTINGVEYIAKDGETLEVTIDNAGNKIISSGITDIPEGDSVFIENSNGEKIKISKPDDGDGSNESIKVSADGTIDAAIGDTIQIGDGTYTNNDSDGDFILDVNPESGEVVAKDGEKIEVTNGNITFEDTSTTPPTKVSVSTEGDETITVEKTDEGTPEVTIPAGGNATITNKDGKEVEVVIPESVGDDTTVGISSNGDLSVDMEAGDKVIIGGVEYEAEKDGTLKVDGSTGKMDETGSTIGDSSNPVTPAIDPERFNKENYQYELEPGESIMVGDTIYTAPEDGSGVILSGNPDGPPIITIKKDGESVIVGNETYTADSDDTKLVVNGPNDITLVDNGKGDGSNSSVAVESPATITIDGNTYTGEGEEGEKALTVSKTENGNNVNVMTGADVSVELGTETDVEVTGGDSVTIGKTEYTAPESGMTLSGNKNSNPTITIDKAGETVKVGNEEYTAGKDNTQIIVNSPNNVTMVDNGQADGANSSLIVKNPSTMTIDGNKITATGTSDGGYVIEKTEEGNSMDIAEDTKVSVTMGANGSDIIINEPASVGGQATGETTTLTSSSGGTTFEIDKTTQNEEEEYVVNITPASGTVMKPIVDENGNVIGFETTKKPTSSNSGSSGSSNKTEEEELEEKTEMQDGENPNDVESQDGEAEDSESEDGESAEDIEGTEEAEEGSEAEEESAENVGTDGKITISDVSEAKDVAVVEEMEVIYGKGSIDVSVNGAGILTSDLEEILKACFTEEDLNAIKAGQEVEIRISILLNEDVDKDALKEIKEAYKLCAKEIDGLVYAGMYDVIVEHRVMGQEWSKLHELNEEIQLTVEIPEEIRAAGRTYFMMRNHEGTCNLLPDVDTDVNTITIRSAEFSIYTIMYTDENVVDLDLEELNITVLSADHSSNAFPWIWVVLGICVIVAFGIIIILIKKRNDEEEIKL